MRAVILAAALAAFLAACSAPAGQQAGGAGAGATQAAPSPLQAQTLLTPDGYGAARIGMRFDEIVAALGPPSAEEAAAMEEACAMFHPARAPHGLAVMIEEGVATRITLFDGSPVMTEGGLSLRSTEAEVRSALGPRLRVEPHHYSEPPAHYLTLWRADPGAVEFVEDRAARGIRFETDERGQVQAIHAGGPSIQYVEGCS